MITIRIMKNLKYKIVRSKQYKRDLRRLARSGRYELTKLDQVIIQLASGNPLSPLLRNHKLQGDMLGLEECHIQGDWVLIYLRQDDVLVLTLTRTGTHSQLFGE